MKNNEHSTTSLPQGVVEMLVRTSRLSKLIHVYSIVFRTLTVSRFGWNKERWATFVESFIDSVDAYRIHMQHHTSSCQSVYVCRSSLHTINPKNRNKQQTHQQLRNKNKKCVSPNCTYTRLPARCFGRCIRFGCTEFRFLFSFIV